MNEAKNVYLLPLFLKNMTYSLKFSEELLCDEMTNLITSELAKTHTEISKRLGRISSKETENKKIIQELKRQNTKVMSKSGGKQIKVLFSLRKLLINLEHCKYLSEEDLAHLKEMVASGDLFFRSYNTGIDVKTIGRFLSVKNKNLQAHDIKIKLLFEIFEKRLKNQTTRELFFKLYFSDAARVRSTFFIYMGRRAQFKNEDIVTNAILNLKNIPFEEFIPKLEYICRDLELIHQAELFPLVEQVIEPVNEEEKDATYDAQMAEDSCYADFHTTAMKFLKTEMSLKIPELDKGDEVQDIYSIVEDAWCVFSKMYHEDIEKGTSPKALPFQELVIHSLHNHQKFHLQLCNSFKNWTQEDAL